MAGRWHVLRSVRKVSTLALNYASFLGKQEPTEATATRASLSKTRDSH